MQLKKTLSLVVIYLTVIIVTSLSRVLMCLCKCLYTMCNLCVKLQSKDKRSAYLTFLSLSPETVSIYCSWIMKAAKFAV